MCRYYVFNIENFDVLNSRLKIIILVFVEKKDFLVYMYFNRQSPCYFWCRPNLATFPNNSGQIKSGYPTFLIEFKSRLFQYILWKLIWSNCQFWFNFYLATHRIYIAINLWKMDLVTVSIEFSFWFKLELATLLFLI